MNDTTVASTPRPDSARETPALVLIAEDEPEIADILIAYLKRSGFRTAHAPDGRRALDMHLALKPDLLLLDVLMPHVDGWQVLAEVRHRGTTPVIMLTAQDQDLDKLMGLRIGADDYIVKPFNPAEVVARTQAVLRRSLAHNDRSSPTVLRVDTFEIDLESYEVTVHIAGKRLPLALTVTEFRLLAQLAKSPKRVFTRAELLAQCSPESDSLERTVDSHISKLRRKIEDAGLQGVPTSIRGVGYRFGCAS
ncbi:response regulator transcription factor [Pseudomonas tolaasii]|uniref:response regulator n=1 Tax=Pseudomonas tolaasii TaxID=29442 RepID=UPI0015A16EFA|nr:response regulator [Pseudomonas tolaasii]NWC30708.1 response regulator transcription factor [Pseudomonas tolaasii]NWC50308.1 response regulator transcription factor [Pseudomonas tolaasii]NWE65030.1 response regulator transcription factor [Pseudomonas tolaasii]